MNVAARGKPCRDGPVEHAGVLRILSGHQKGYRLAAQHDSLILARHADDRFGIHVTLHGSSPLRVETVP
jgi:hypothetical protein